MLSFLMKKQQTDGIIGVDINAHFIKLLIINSAKIPHQIEYAAVLPLANGVIIKGEIKEPSAIISILKKQISAIAIKTKRVAFAVPRSAVIIKNTTIDNRLTNEEIELRAWVEAERHFPELIGHIYLDFKVGDVVANNPSQLELMLIACRKEQINPYLEIFKQADLQPSVIDISTYALRRALVAMLADSAMQKVGLLNIDYTLSTLIVLDKKQFIYDHDHSYDGARLMSQTAEFFKNNMPATGLDDPNYVSILQERLGTHLRHTMHIFFSNRPNVQLQRIFLAGECATIPHLASYIQKETNIDTTVANPLANMNMATSVDKTKVIAEEPWLMLSCGLALSSVNSE